ncbi:MAG: hypothetical protein HY043_01055 [Verrucomicrobia bacterium]|nr:hypothetical protein [Verrucomicrobiota bacterium]
MYEAEWPTRKQRIDTRPRLHYLFFLPHRRRLAVAVCVSLLLPLHPSSARDLRVTPIGLPPLRVNGQPARAHTQGLELVAGKYYVTARRDDVRPKRALLLRADARGTNWDVWDITPTDARGELTTFDHPGGMQSDGNRLWIPLAESKRKGRSLIRVFRMADMVAGRPLKAEFEFPVNDHIGAVAVSAGRKLVFGANWDTEQVYVWDFDGRLQRTLEGPELESRGLGVVSGANGRAGLAVQDWKMIGDRLFASGLFGGIGAVPGSPQSQLNTYSRFPEPGFQQKSIWLPKQDGTELAQEAMAISNGRLYFLPDDLGASNRIFRVPLSDMMKRSLPQKSLTSQAR